MRSPRAPSRPVGPVLVVGVARALVAMALAACAAKSGADYEVISAVPTYVLHVEDLAARVQRAPQELGTELGGVRVTAVLVRRAETCEPTRSGRCVLRHVFADPGGREMEVELVDDPDALQVGRSYVLRGAVEPTNEVARRWIFRGFVLAVVR